MQLHNATRYKIHNTMQHCITPGGSLVIIQYNTMTTTRATRTRAAEECNQPSNFQLEKYVQGVFSFTFGFRNIMKRRTL